jgi:hypothetical protein
MRRRDLQLRARVYQAVGACSAAFADGSLTMIMLESQLGKLRRTRGHRPRPAVCWVTMARCWPWLAGANSTLIARRGFGGGTRGGAHGLVVA